jgi:hypothetical protein
VGLRHVDVLIAAGWCTLQGQNNDEPSSEANVRGIPNKYKKVTLLMKLLQRFAMRHKKDKLLNLHLQDFDRLYLSFPVKSRSAYVLMCICVQIVFSEPLKTVTEFGAADN